ncbi:serine--tRNA ligase [Micrococcales bacterium 31B]|nr:serine--tRNA ligase [Micrococcales bacterium 31B]
MIELKILRDTPDVVRESQRRRGDDPQIVDQVLDLDAQWRAATAEFESSRARQKTLGKEVAQAKGDEKQALLAETKELAARVKHAEAQAKDLEAQRNEAILQIASLVSLDAPVGGEDDYAVVKTVGTARDFAAEGFEPRDHLELGEMLKAIDMERGTKVSGTRFYFLTGVGARLELAILNAAIDKAVAHGFTPIITPTLVRPETMSGTGFLGKHSDEVYRLEKQDLYLVGTSEVALAGYHGNEILDLTKGPLRYAGWSACYRSEAGSYGKDTRGIIRVHQFHKVEMFSFCPQEQAADEHQKLLAMEEDMLQMLELPYRVIDTATGDLGTSATRKFDCEAWVPTQGKYRELTSTSNCGTFQALRLNVRERSEGGTRAVATLNGTLATTRWLVAILENHQQADGSVRVPEGLRPYLGGLDVLQPVA